MTERHYGTVAVFADIHANLPALEAVLTQAQASGAEAFVLLGDIALGPMPAPTLDLLDSLGERAIWVHGNCEREVVAAFDATEPPAPNGAAEDTMAAAAATAALLSRGHRDRLAGLPLTVTLDIDGLGPTLFCHASPRRDDEMVLVDSPPERWAAVLADVAAATVVCGHTHMQFDRLAAGHRVINAGSVGMPYGPPGACWALLGPDVTLPLFTGGTLDAEESAAYAKFREASEDYRGVVLGAFQEVEDNLALIHWLGTEETDETAAVAAAQRTLDSALDLYRQGATSYLEVVTAQTALLQAQQAAIDVQTRQLEAEVGLARALGGGWRQEDLPSDQAVTVLAAN